MSITEFLIKVLLKAKSSGYTVQYVKCVALDAARVNFKRRSTYIHVSAFKNFQPKNLNDLQMKENK